MICFLNTVYIKNIKKALIKLKQMLDLKLTTRITYHNVIVHGFVRGLGKVQVQVHVLLFAADGIVTLATRATCDVLP